MHYAAAKRISKRQLERVIDMTTKTNLTAAVCSLLALGLVACGGGGGGDGGNPSNAPPANSKAQINETNAKQVSQSTVQRSNASGKGTQSGAGAIRKAPQTPTIPALSLARGMTAKALAGTESSEACPGGGTRDFNFEGLPTDPTQLPGAIVVTAANCVEEGITSNGVMRLSDLVFEDARIGASIEFDSFSVLDPGEGIDSTLKGVTTFLIETTATTEKLVFGVTNLEVKEGSDVTQIPRLETVVETNRSTQESNTSLSGTVQTPEGLVDLVTEQPFVAIGEDNPTAGRLKIVGELSSVTLVPRLDGLNVDLSVDNADVDPAVDVVVPATWQELGTLL